MNEKEILEYVRQYGEKMQKQEEYWLNQQNRDDLSPDERGDVHRLYLCWFDRRLAVYELYHQLKDKIEGVTL